MIVISFNRLEHQGGAVQTTLASDIASGDATLSLTASTNWPGGSGGPFYLVVYALNNGVRTNEEKILATSRSTTTLAGLTRGVDGTAAVSHTAGEIIEHIFTAAEADEANRLVASTLGAVTAKGDLTPATSAGVLGKLAAGSNGLPLVADSTQTTGLGYAQLAAAGIATDAVDSAQIKASAVGTAEIAAGAVTTAKLDAALAGQLTPSEARVLKQVTVGAATLTSASYVDFGPSTTVVVPNWATKAIVRTAIQGWGSSAASGTSVNVVKVVLGSASGVERTMGVTAVSHGSDINVSYIDMFTGLSPGTLTLKTQAKCSLGSNNLQTVNSLADFDVEFLP